MGRPERMRNIVGILKDKVSILKATLRLPSKPTTSLHVAVLRATTHHHPVDPPPVDAVLSLANTHLLSSGVLVHALLRRVHGTHSAYVALKCLVTLHHVITQGSPVLKDHIVGYSTGPLFNLSEFRDGYDRDTWELSNWVRWYADVLDYTLSLSRKNRASSTSKSRLSNLSSLVVMLEKICGAPETLHYQRLTLIYEVIKMVGEDYRLIMREINTKVNQFRKKSMIEEMSDDMLQELLSDLKRIENCKEKLLLMFLNKKKNDGVWELIEQVRKDVEEVKEKREKKKLNVGERESRSLVAVPATRGRRWLDVEWNPLVASYG